MLKLQPLVISEVVSFVGGGKSVALFVSALVGVYHWRSFLRVMSTAGFVTKILGVVALILVAGALGLIQGVSLSIATDTLIGTVEWLLATGRQIVEVVA